MLKGVNRNVIMIRSDGNSRFEAVYFVMKKGSAGDKNDMLREANKIIGDSGLSVRRKNAFGRGGIIFLGVLIGVILSSLLWLTVILTAF